MVEVMEGSGVYWNASQRQCVLGSSSNITQLVSNMVDCFFDKNTLSVSNVKGGKYTALNQAVVQAITGILLQ